MPLCRYPGTLPKRSKNGQKPVKKHHFQEKTQVRSHITPVTICQKCTKWCTLTQSVFLEIWGFKIGSKIPFPNFLDPKIFDDFSRFFLIFYFSLFSKTHKKYVSKSQTILEKGFIQVFTRFSNYLIGLRHFFEPKNTTILSKMLSKVYCKNSAIL